MNIDSTPTQNGVDSHMSQTMRTIGLAALLSVYSSVCAHGQIARDEISPHSYQKQSAQSTQAPHNTTVSSEVPPIFTEEGATSYRLSANNGATPGPAPSVLVFEEIPREDIITLEPGMPEFKSKGDAGRYVANKLGIVSLYAKTPVGNVWKLGSESKLKASLGLRNLSEPRAQIVAEDVMGSGFNAKLESRLREPASIAVYKRVDGGEIGIYGSLERRGDVRAYFGIQAKSMRIFQSFK